MGRKWRKRGIDEGESRVVRVEDREGSRGGRD